MQAAVDVVGRRGDVAGVLAHQEGQQGGNVLDGADPAQGMSALICALRSSVSVPPMMSVSIGPGATEFTVMLCGPISRANAREKPITAALDAL